MRKAIPTYVDASKHGLYLVEVARQLVLLRELAAAY